MNKKLIAVAVFLSAAIAFAVPQVFYTKHSDPNPEWFSKGVFLGSTARNPVSSTSNMITGSFSATADHDFADAGFGEVQDFDIAVSGARVGDICFNPGIYTVLDGGGVAVHLGHAEASAFISCHVHATDTVEVTLYPVTQVDLPDASFTVRVISNQ